jgi:hypothetical protein
MFRLLANVDLGDYFLNKMQLVPPTLAWVIFQLKGTSLVQFPYSTNSPKLLQCLKEVYIYATKEIIKYNSI